MIVTLRRMAPAFPGLIVAVSLASLAVVLATLPVETIASRFGALPNTLPLPALPSVTVERVVELFPSAIVIAFLAGVESLLSAMVADRMIEGSHRPNAEMLAQEPPISRLPFLAAFRPPVPLPARPQTSVPVATRRYPGWCMRLPYC